MLNPFSAITAKIYGGIAIVAITFAAIQTVRIEGLWFIKGYQERLEQAKERNDKLIAAAEAARIEQQRLNNERKKTDTENARIADADFSKAKTVADAATIRYIDRWRVRTESCTAGSNTAPESQNTGVPETMPAFAVMVSERDVQACSGAAAYALSAHNHAMRQIETGVAE